MLCIVNSAISQFQFGGDYYIALVGGAISVISGAWTGSDILRLSRYLSFSLLQTSESFAISVNLKKERAVNDCSLSQRLGTSIVKTLFMVCQRHGCLAQQCVKGIMCLFHCPGSNGTIMRFCRESVHVADTRFLGLV